jgi:hypothetical protein
MTASVIPSRGIEMIRALLCLCLAVTSAQAKCLPQDVQQEIYTAPVPNAQHRTIAGLGEVWIVTRCNKAGGDHLRAMEDKGVLDNAESLQHIIMMKRGLERGS